jgi:hypothetical protein
LFDLIISDVNVQPCGFLQVFFGYGLFNLRLELGV